MPSLPEGEPVPQDGGLPPEVADGSAERALGVYLHVPFCTRRCGYCDFNTYTPAELTGPRSGGAAALTSSYLSAVRAEIALAARVIKKAGVTARPVGTVFVGGGTPTMLAADDLVALLGVIEDTWGLAAGAEVTTEANPDSVDAHYLAMLAGGGFTRVSFGMQSAVPHVLATLDRSHDADRVEAVVDWARQAGLATSLDLIYGTPGESPEDWQATVTAAIALAPDHVSAYALTVEPGTALHRSVRRGELAAPDPDDQADNYEAADDLLGAAGYHWYEVSNWARTPSCVCRHNLGYWRGDDWWGFGPGAHSHLGGVRWWNVTHPSRYADRLSHGLSPAAARERPDPAARQLERVMLGLRLREGLPAAELTGSARNQLAGLHDQGLLDGLDPVVLSRRGRLLADHVVRTLLGWGG